MRRVVLIFALLIGGLWPAMAAAQGTAAAPAATTTTTTDDDPDLDFDPLQPDFTIINLPTTLRLPRHKSAFRVTHRFGRPLGAGDFGDLASDFFGFDNGAQIGLEYRFGLMRGLEVGIYRTSNRTIEFFGQRNLLQERDSHPIGLGIIASIDGTDNFSDEFTPAVGLAVSRTLGGVSTVYVEPIYVGNVNIAEDFISADDNTFVLGLGARLRIRPTVYLVGEFDPRLAGYDAGVNLGSFGLEKRAGGHTFQINFSNGIGTTMGQIARGGTGRQDWYVGFNISRKFF
jgi:hypothetical protein